MTPDELKQAKKVIGAKQSLKAIERGQVAAVFLGSDAESRVVQPLKELCSQKEILVVTDLSMLELGKAAGIEVGAAAIAVLK